MKTNDLFKGFGILITGALIIFGGYIYYSFYSPWSIGKHLKTNEQVTDLHTNYKSKFADVDGLKVHYRDEGTGYPLILIHGLSTSLHVWNDWTKEMEDDHRIIRLDLPGFGLTDFPQEQSDISSIDFYIEFVDKFLDEIGVDQCNMAGNSLGGWITWEYAASHPERINRIVLLNAAGYHRKDTRSRSAAVMRNPLAKRLVTTGVPKFLIKHVARKSFADNKLITKELVQQYYDIINREGNLMALISLVQKDIIPNEQKIKNVQAPTLIMWGEKDRIISVNNAYWFNEDIPNSKMIIYPEIGHTPNTENSTISAMDASNFLLNTNKKELVSENLEQS